MIYNAQDSTAGQYLQRQFNRFDQRLTTNWPPSYRTIEGALNVIPGSVMETFSFSGPTICLPDCSNANIAAE